jgi:CheY-like chemotaxis protein
MPLNILAVDDSKTIRTIVKKAFKPYDCEVFEAENGADGLTAAMRIKPDLIVLDITMPVLNGIEMLTKLKSDQNLKNIPVIMLTAESGKDNVMLIMKMGVNNYIVKPFKDVQLIERVQKVITLKPRADKPSEEQSKKYFSPDGVCTVFILPAKISRETIAEIELVSQAKIEEIKTPEKNKMIFDFSQVSEISVPLVKLVVVVAQSCKKAGVQTRVACPAALSKALKEFQETNDLIIHDSLDEAKAAFSS